MQHKGDRYGLAEVKNEIGSKGAEPNAQATAYYLESTRRRAVDCPKSPLPCFLLYIFGEDLRFTFPCVTQTIVVRPVYWVWWCGMEPSTHCASPFYRSAVAFPLLRWSTAEGHDTLLPCEKQFVLCGTITRTHYPLSMTPSIPHLRRAHTPT